MGGEIWGRARIFVDIKAWKLAYGFVLYVYKFVPALLGNEKYGLLLQMKGSALSISANIAESFKREDKMIKLIFTIWLKSHRRNQGITLF
ncbi:MAG: four helix bundle protein [Candidatus Dadabacteria bacterium]|nr:MAG: four helix bundle protein [Candidatus Dadabacteria bacterium]